jgi:hypothetical protein
MSSPSTRTNGATPGWLKLDEQYRRPRPPARAQAKRRVSAKVWLWRALIVTGALAWVALAAYATRLALEHFAR